VPPIPLYWCDAYTWAIILYPLGGYEHSFSRSPVSTVSPIRCSSVENGISGITRLVTIARSRTASRRGLFKDDGSRCCKKSSVTGITDKSPISV
jgi:hypothetical protein